PTWTLVAGQVISWLSGLPVLLVTAFGTLTVVYRSGSRWTPAPAWVFLGVAGWSIGVIPAIADGTIAVNSVMHNTQWVPGHFHIYLLLGMVAMVLGFMTYLTNPQPRSGFAWTGYWLYVAGGVIFVLAVLLALVLAAGLAALACETNGFRVMTSAGARQLSLQRAPQRLPDARLVDQD